MLKMTDEGARSKADGLPMDLDALAREGVRRMLAEALEAEVLPILYRLLHNSHVLDIKGRSYRLRDLEQAVKSANA